MVENKFYVFMRFSIERYPLTEIQDPELVE